MIKLIKNELIKIFHKKTIYVMLIIMFAFILLNIIITKVSFKNTNYTLYTPEYIEMLKSELEDLDYKDSTQVDQYISLKTELDKIELQNKYDKNSWQFYIIGNVLQSYIYDLNVYEYNPNNRDSINKEDLLNEYQMILEYLEKGDWRFFANKQLENAKEELSSLENQKKLFNSQQIDLEIEKLKAEIYTLNKRLENDIPYGNDYLNNAISEYTNSYNTLLDINYNQDSFGYYDSFEEDSEYNKKLRLNNITENIALSKYIIETKQDIMSTDNLRNELMNSYDNYELLIIVLIVIISGSIVSEEFNKGTIKLLLVRPYSREKILLAKFITIILIILFAIISLQIMQFVLGIIILGTQSLNIPVVVYNFNINSIQTMSLIKYMFINTLAKLPLYILVSTIAFFVSTMFSNTSIGITIALLGYMSSVIINTLISIAYSKNIKFLKYFITMHWDFTEYMFGNLPTYSFVNLPLSIIMCILYFLFMIIITFILFKRKEIKNI